MSVQNILRFTADLSRGVVMTPLRMAFIRGEDMGHCFLIQAEQEGKKLPLTGASVNGFMIRADGTTLTIAGTVADGLASLALPAAAYAVPGRFRLVIQSALSGVTTTLFWGEGAVSPSYTDIVAIPEEIIVPSLENIEAQIERMEAATAAAESAAQGAVVRNLLDNSDFRNPINQRGAETYTGAANYCIDRWKLQYNTIIEVEDGYVKLDGQYDLSQRNAVPIRAGQAYTIAARMRAVGAVNAYLKGPGEAWRIFTVPETWQTHVASGIAGEDIAIGGCDIAHINLQKSEGYLEIEWVAVYEGAYTAETLPSYQPKGYAAELAECQRYYIHIGGGAYSWLPVCKIHGWGSVVAIPANMRIGPTVIARTDGGIVILNNAGEWKETTLFGVYQRGTTVYVVLNDVENTDGGKSYIAEGIVGLSADL